MTERVLGGVLVGFAAVLAAVVESFLVALRLGDTRVPVSIVLAVLLNPAFTVLMRGAAGSRLAAAVPTALWLVVVVALGSARREGDVVVTGDLVGTLFVLLGSLAGTASLLLVGPLGRPARPRDRSSPPAAPALDPPPT